jgi:hypothetical protein
VFQSVVNQNHRVKSVFVLSGLKNPVLDKPTTQYEGKTLTGVSDKIAEIEMVLHYIKA